MRRSDVQGIRTPRDAGDKRFMRFFEVVQDAAKRSGKVFFLNADEGHELVTDEMDGEDLSGWLIAPQDVPTFEPIWRENPSELPDDFLDCMCMAEWSAHGSDIRIGFRML